MVGKLEKMGSALLGLLVAKPEASAACPGEIRTQCMQKSNGKWYWADYCVPTHKIVSWSASPC